MLERSLKHSEYIDCAPILGSSGAPCPCLVFAQFTDRHGQPRVERTLNITRHLMNSRRLRFLQSSCQSNVVHVSQLR